MYIYAQQARSKPILKLAGSLQRQLLTKRHDLSLALPLTGKLKHLSQQKLLLNHLSKYLEELEPLFH
jgi:hypothetical protein